MDQEKRVLLAFALSFAVLLLWRALFMKQTPPPPMPAPAAASAPVTPAPRPQPEAKAPAPAELPVVEGSKAQEITVEGGDLYQVTFDTRGAVVKSWILKKYRDQNENPLEVVNRAACEQLGFPLSLSLADAELSKKLSAALYVATPGDASRRSPGSLEFVYSDGRIQARKKFSFGPGYEIHAEVSVFDGQRYLPVEVSWPGGFGDYSLPPEMAASAERAFYQTVGGNVKEEALIPSRLKSTVSGSPPKEQEDIPPPLALAGLEDRYFVDAFLLNSPEVKFNISRKVWTPPDWKGEEKDKPKPLAVKLGALRPEPLAFRLFVAPKDLDVLRATKPPLDGLVDFGWFTVVAKPLFISLRYVYDHWVHNYGWAIILLTILINLALFPLKWKGIRSAQEMQRIAPQVKAIQERYKQYKFNDPRKQRMQEETMKLYREHGINPFGGCLPMVMQMPFLYAFYNVLSLSIELRHAPWILWVKDLSAPDHLAGIPVPVLPVLMMITMFIVQKMTPMTTTDPAQQRMMMLTPLIFGFMFFRFASGLVLYWLTGNLVGIGQQAFLNRRLPSGRLAPTPPAP